MDIDDEINKLQNIIIDCNKKIDKLKKNRPRRKGDILIINPYTYDNKDDEYYYDVKFLKYYINSFILPKIIQNKINENI